VDERTRRTQREYDQEAATYDRSAWADRLLMGDSRERLCGEASGRTLEVAIGTGLNLDHYRDDVLLVGVDLSAGMLRVAAQRARDVGRRVRLIQSDAQRLPFSDSSFDSLVCTLSLCAIPDQTAAVAEMYRVLVPGGRLLLVDHVEYAKVPMRWVERFRTQLHAHRERPLDVVRRQGFVVDRLDRLAFGFVDRIVAHHPAPQPRPRLER
jgi:ubiquinone/menaquinone biosynthesis C-methylase UbiE